MKKILFYVSEHGLGHLTRSIALIRELENEAQIMIRNSNESFLKKSVPSIPIFTGNNVTAVIEIFSEEKRLPSQEDLSFIRLVTDYVATQFEL